MSTYVIKWLKDKLGTRFFPVTHINAVRDDTGTSLASMLEAKQDTLVSGTNIKTVNNNSLVGSGNVSIATGDTNVIETIKVNNTALTPDANKAVNISAVTSFNGSTGAVTYTAPVTSVNGETGAVTLSIPSEVTETTVSGWGFTKNEGTITGITMNGASKGTSGVVNLGTVITSHQDISGKADKSTTTTAGTYKSVTVNSSGIVTGGSNPTTIAGYGITDAYSKAETDGRYYALYGGTALSATSSVHYDLNNLTDFGSYYCATNTISSYIDNKPTNEQLAFMVWVSSSTGVDSYYIRQRLQYYDRNKIYERVSTSISSITWGSWDLVQDTLELTTSNTYVSNGTGYINNSAITTISGNANTATSLATPRSIWGKSFDGTSNIAGTLFMLSSEAGATSNTASGKLKFNSASTDGTNVQRSPYIQALPHTYVSYGRKRLGVFQSNATNFTDDFVEVVSILPDGKVGIGNIAPTTLLHVNGVVTCTSVSQTSDESKKEKVDDISISVEKIAQAPNITFKWKEGEDKELHGGTYAQYWEKITPYYVHGDEEKSMDYASLSLSCAIELAKEVVQLKEENAQLKREIAEIKEMLKRVL